MGQVTHEQAELMLRLYELRREPKLREARAWFVENFRATTPEEMMKLCPPGSETNAFLRMVTSYWEMVANLVNRGLIDEELFFETTGEQWIVWDRLKQLAPKLRAMFQNPHAYENLEKHCTRFEAWREKRSPGSNAVMRQILAQARSQSHAASHSQSS